MPERDPFEASPPSLKKAVWLVVPAWAALAVEAIGVFFSTGGRHAIHLGKLWAPMILFTTGTAFLSPFFAGGALKVAIRNRIEYAGRRRLFWKLLLLLIISFLVGIVNFGATDHPAWASGYR